MIEQRLDGFQSAVKAVLKVLHRRLGFDLWIVARNEGEHWVVLDSEDHGYGIEPGRVFNWANSLCKEMMLGNGPNITPNSEEDPAYASALIARELPVKSYIGLPLCLEDGTLFGTLCAIHPNPKPPSILNEKDLLELMATLLSKILQAELRTEAEMRRAEKREAESLSDKLTGLFNRRGWDRLLANEEHRCQRFGHSAAVFVIDLDHLKEVNDTLGHSAGDALLIQTATQIKKVARSLDVVARLGGDEFGILCAECDAKGAKFLLNRIRKSLAEQNIGAAIGFAMRDPGKSLHTAWESADARMYQDKRTH